MFKNLTIKTKIITSFTLSFLFICFVAFYSYNQVNKMDSLLKENKSERFPNTVEINKVIDFVNELSIDLGYAEAVEASNVNTYTQKINNSFDGAFKVLENLSKIQHENTTVEHLNDLKTDLENLKSTYQKIEPYLISDKAQASSLIINTYIPSRSKMMKSLFVALEYESNQLKKHNDDAQNIAETTNFVLIFVVILGMIMGILVAIYIIRDFTIPLNAIVDAASKIAKGDFNYTLACKNNDEISKVEDALDNIVDNIQNLVNKFNVVTQNMIIGNFNVEIDNNGLNGAFLDLNENLKSTLNSTKNILNVSDNINIMISDKEGNILFINEHMCNLFKKYEIDLKEALPHFEANNLIGKNMSVFHIGDGNRQYNMLSQIKSTYNTKINIGRKIFNLNITPNYHSKEIIGFIVEWSEITSLANFERRLGKLITAATNGDLSYKISYENIDGSYLESAKNINSMIESIKNPIDVTNDYLNKISNGVLPTLIQTEYQGVYNELKISFNQTISTLTAFKDEMNKMSEDHNRGFIFNYIDINKFNGIYKEIAEGVNTNVNSHVKAKQMALGVFDEFGKGNFSADIEQLPNEKAFINKTINSVRNNLLGFNNEILGLLEAAKRGDLSYRAKTHGFEGGWREMAEGLNDLMEEISVPLNEAGSVLSELTSGNLGARAYGQYNGEFENLKSNINYLSETLEQVIRSVVESVNNTASTANQLSQTADNMSAAAHEQSSQTDDVASAVEEMTVTIAENAQSSVRTQHVAERNGQIANEGGEVVGQTISKMKEIASIVEHSAKNIEKLGQSSKEIGEIISVIEDIADQTNLLALNAAIEAARAGEQGRGFAVVADEVRKLAERTTDATKQIASMIKGIQADTQAAVTEMKQGNSEVQQGISLADKAGNSLKQILESSNEVYQMISQISAASEEQSATSEQISKNVVAISRVVADSALQIEEIAKSSEDLSRQTNLLTEILSQFRLSNNNFEVKKSQNQLLSGFNTLKMLKDR